MFFRPFDRLIGDGDDGDSRRKRDRLLHAGEADVDAPAVEVDGDAAEGGDGIDEHERVGCFVAHDSRERRDVVGDAGRRFVVRDRDGVVMRAMVFRQMRRQFLGVDGATPAAVESIDFVAERFSDVVPAFGERSARRHQHATRDAVLERGLHHAGARRGHDERRLLRGEELLEIAVDAAEEIEKLRAAMADHRPRQLLQDLGTNPGRAGDEVLGVSLFCHGFTRYGRTARNVGSTT